MLGIFFVKIQRIGGVRHQIIALELPLIDMVHASNAGGTLGQPSVNQIINVNISAVVQRILFRLIGRQYRLLFGGINPGIYDFIKSHMSSLADVAVNRSGGSGRAVCGQQIVLQNAG